LGRAPYAPGRVGKVQTRGEQTGTNGKTDLLASDGDPEDVRTARAKLARLEQFIREMDYYDGWVHDIVPTSGKYSQNLRSVVRISWIYVEEARSEESWTSPIHSL
jgi:hypothetical protein